MKDSSEVAFNLQAELQAAQSELAAPREELTKYRNLNDSLMAVNLELANCKDTYKKLREKKVSAEQRNAELVELLKRAKPYIPWNRFGSSQYQWNTEVKEALKPTEFGASE